MGRTKEGSDPRSSTFNPFPTLHDERLWSGETVTLETTTEKLPTPPPKSLSESPESERVGNREPYPPDGGELGKGGGGGGAVGG